MIHKEPDRSVWVGEKSPPKVSKYHGPEKPRAKGTEICTEKHRGHATRQQAGDAGSLCGHLISSVPRTSVQLEITFMLCEGERNVLSPAWR